MFKNSDLKVLSHQKFVAGRLKKFSRAWEKITSDKVILSMVSGCKIEFENGREPDQVVIPKQLNFCKKEEEIIDAELHKLLKKQVIEPAMHCPGEFISPIFIRPKKDGSYRLILNLKQLNESVEYHHFKMESVMSAIKLMKPGCFVASVDLKDAYYSVSVKECYRKFLRFLWKGKLFSVYCAPKRASMLS